MRRRTMATLLCTLAAGCALSGCSYEQRFAATINGNGHVQIETCLGVASFQVVNTADHTVVQVRGPATSNLVAADLEQPFRGWAIDGHLDLGPDDVIEIWDGGAPVAATTPPTGSTTTDAYARSPSLTFRPRDLRAGSYWYDGAFVSPKAWHDACNPDDGTGACERL